MDEPGAVAMAGPKLRRVRDRWGTPVAFGLAVVIGAIGVAFFIAAGNQVGWTRTWFDDLAIYRDATARILSGDGWYLPRQLNGPYLIESGDVLYPPVAAWFFVPWLFLPAWTFSAIPLAIVAVFVARARPAPWTWPVIAFCLVFPVSLIYIAYANPTIWISAFVALGLRYGWPGVLVLLKPSLAPFALIGTRSRGWWIGLVVLAVGSLPFLAPTIDYPRILLDARGASFLYSGTSIPIVVLPLVAWLGRTVDRSPRVDVGGQTRPETQ